jgi:hypothetical protein
MGNQFAAVHGEGLAHILSTHGVTPAEQADEFTTQLLVVMSGQMVSTQTNLQLKDEHLTTPADLRSYRQSTDTSSCSYDPDADEAR